MLPPIRPSRFPPRGQSGISCSCSNSCASNGSSTSRKARRLERSTPPALMALVVAMPIIGRWRAGHVFNVCAHFRADAGHRRPDRSGVVQRLARSRFPSLGQRSSPGRRAHPRIGRAARGDSHRRGDLADAQRPQDSRSGAFSLATVPRAIASTDTMEPAVKSSRS